MITRLSTLIVIQNDLAAGVAFYKSLGLKLAFEIPSRWAEFILPEGTKLCLCPTSQELNSQRHTGFVFEVKDLKQLHEQLKESTTFVNEPTEKEYGIIASIADPAGNVIDLFEPDPEKIQEMMRKQRSACQGSCDEGGCPGGSCPAEGASKSERDDSSAEG